MSFDNYKKYIKPLLASEQEWENFVKHLHKPLKKSINIIQSRLSTKEFIKYVKTQGRSLSSSIFAELASTFYIDRSDTTIALGSHYLHQAGYFYTQEVAASIPANFIELGPNALILDMCAAPGGKTIQLADRLTSQYPEAIGCIRSNDVSAKRLQVLQANINRSGLYNTVVSKINGYSFGKALPEVFDAILLDAPCSGEGTSFRSSESLKFRNPQAIKTIANTQYQLLISALKSCKVGGAILYSTCTINEQENEHNIHKLLKEYGYCCKLEMLHLTGKATGVATNNGLNQDEAKKCIRCWPHIQHTGGFFVAKIRKTASIPTNTKKTENFSTNTITTSKALQTQVATLLQNQWGISLSPSDIIVETSQYIFLTSKRSYEVLKQAVIEKIGIPIYKKTKDGLKPLHGLACTLGKHAKHNIIALTRDQAQRYTQKENIEIKELGEQNQDLQEGKYYLIAVDGLMVSVGKITQGVIKNKFVGV